MTENDEGYFSGTEPIREAEEAEFDIDELKAAINRLEIQLGHLILQRDDLAVETDKAEGLEKINAEIRTVEMNIGANRLKLQGLVNEAAPKLTAADDRITEITEGQKPN